MPAKTGGIDILSEKLDTGIPSSPAEVQIFLSIFEGKKMAVFSAASAVFAEEEQEQYETILSEKFERETYRGKWIRFLVLLPDRRVTAAYREAVFAALAAIQKRTSPLSYIVLTETEVNCDNLRFSLWNTYGVKAIIFFGHANSHVGRVVQRWTQQVAREGVQRTQIQCYAGKEGYFRTRYENVGMASYTRQTRPDAEPLPDGMDQRMSIPQAVSVLQQQDVGIREALFGKDGNLNNTQGLLDRDSTDDDTLTFYGLGDVGSRRFGYYGAQQ